jgi:gamma-glutamylcyclotransferase (GGCT)/AIG2-like uncharacterized protein YtfP
MDVFAYGSLMLPQTMQAVTGRRFLSTNAVLKGFGRYRIAREIYPALVPEEGTEVKGVLYFHVDRRSLLRIDDYEGGVVPTHRR